jgi:hypothetical protein
MKKVIIYAAALLPIILVWLHWGGFKNTFGTLILAVIAVFVCTFIGDRRRAVR